MSIADISVVLSTVLADEKFRLQITIQCLLSYSIIISYSKDLKCYYCLCFNCENIDLEWLHSASFWCFYIFFKNSPIRLKETPWEEDNLFTRVKLPIPNVSFLCRRFYCSSTWAHRLISSSEYIHVKYVDVYRRIYTIEPCLINTSESPDGPSFHFYTEANTEHRTPSFSV